MTDANHEAIRPTGTPLPPKPVNLDGLEVAYRQVLLALGQGDKAEVMANTPRRIAEMWADVINAPWCDIEIPWKCFPNPGIDDLVMVTDCHYISYCEHHLAPAFGVAHFGYVPDKLVTGYSKIKKGLNYISRQPQLNERLLVEVLNAIEASVAPRWCGLILHSIHSCLACKANAPSDEIVTIQGFRGRDRESSYTSWRSEFLATCYGRRPTFGP